MVGTAGHLCVCNADFDATINANGDVKCEASLESARQLPSGPRIETGYLSDEDVYRHEYPSGRDEERKHRGRLDGESSRRTEGSAGNTDEGRRTNQGSGKDSGHAGSGGSGRSEQSDGDAGSDGAKSGGRKEEKEEGKGGPAAAIAGGVIGGLLLLGAAGGGVAYAMKRKKADERDQVEYESGGGAREDSEDVEVLVDVDDKTWE
ncbi:microneme protein MIC6 [Besnoitia besnoiti]|uniref:Microneme protein MIC6 n=1 Tax=Besnoitia besnoiti TaxID=94643 RepID=A0A2A9MHV8_BESBE|nr:microneme protein MIC6 [Besnoitia besnoiti]PFH37479.1 microneme protein MIC6 [Besnoitia besnoiti]